MKELNHEQEKASQVDQEGSLKHYYVWDRGVRWFHWINVIAVLGLIAVGTVILNATSLGVSSEGKVDLKILHAWIGYVFALNLLWRIIWGFIGSPYARWSAILPGGTGYGGRLKEWLLGVKAGKVPSYRGHNPAARLMLAVLFFVLCSCHPNGDWPRVGRN